MYLTNRFFWFAGAVIALFGISYPLDWLFPLAQTGFAAMVILTAGDLFVLFYRRPQVTARRNTASVFSLGDPNPVLISVENRSSLNLHASITDELPVQLQIRDFSMSQWLVPGEKYILEHKLTPLSRGIYRFGHINIFVTTRLGLAERRLKEWKEEDVRVYPSIIQMKRFELRATKQIAHETGVKKMRRLGHSYEFEQIKNYVPGDDYRSVNWKASGRRGTIMVNQYEDEKSQQIYCLIDKSRVMRMPFEGLSLMDYAINTSLAISNIVLKKQDKAGLITFSDVIGATIKAERKAGQLNKILEALYKEKERKGEANYELMYEAMSRLINVRSLLLLFTNFESHYALERALPALRRLNRQHLLVAVFFENTEIRKLAGEPVEKTTDIFRQTIARQFLLDKREMVYKLRQYGIQTILTRPQDLTLDTINKYLELKSRGLI